jgi:hypothetical protein
VKPETLDGLHDAAARRRRDHVGTTEDARHGGGRNAGTFGDFVDGRHVAKERRGRASIIAESVVAPVPRERCGSTGRALRARSESTRARTLALARALL